MKGMKIRKFGAIDIGSSKVIVVIGKLNDQKFEIIGVGMWGGDLHSIMIEFHFEIWGVTTL